MLKNLFLKLSCPHDWEELHKYSIFEHDDDNGEINYNRRPIKIIHLMKCKKCGKLKKITIQA